MPRERRLRGVNSSAVRHRITLDDDPEEIDITNVLQRSKRRVFEIIREHAARSDTESADHATSVSSKKLRFPMVFKKRNDKLPTCEAGNKDSTAIAVIDEEEKIDTCLQRPGSNTNDAEGVVYAELDLAHRVIPSSTVPATVRSDQDKTEYAEIIHLPKPK